MNLHKLRCPNKRQKDKILKKALFVLADDDKNVPLKKLIIGLAICLLSRTHNFAAGMCRYIYNLMYRVPKYNTIQIYNLIYVWTNVRVHLVSNKFTTPVPAKGIEPYMAFFLSS